MAIDRQEKEMPGTLVYEGQAWGRLALFICEHTQVRQCARPKFARARLGWYGPWMTYILDRIEDDSWFWSFMFNYFPIVVGFPVVICASCQSVVALSRINEWLYSFISSMVEDDRLQFVVYPDLGIFNEENSECCTTTP